MNNFIETKRAAIQAVRVAMLSIVSMILTSSAWADISTSTRTEVQLPAVAGFTLEPGHMYVVGSSMTINAAHGNGLNVAPKGAEQQAPILYIPADVTLTVTGADAQGIVGGGAGIYVPADAELIITGAGKIVAIGGNAGNGEDGQAGQNASERPRAITKDLQACDFNLAYSGAGGRGGNGGGGAGAGIGGNGGAGGLGGQGGAPVYFTNEAAGESSASQKDGNPGLAGENGNAGTPMGKVSITGSVTVNATPGAAATAGGQGGAQGFSAYHDTNSSILGITVTYRNIAGAGGAGGGGGAGFAAPQGIGAGGRGAGGGAGGGSGAVDWILDWAYIAGNQFSGRAASGEGGKGSVVGANGEQTRPADTGGVATSCPKKGGTAGEGGSAGAADANCGTLYAANSASLTGGQSNSTTAPNDMQITITFVNGVSEIGTKTVTIGESLPSLEESFALTASSKYFAGYYSEANGLGYRIYRGNLENVVPAVRYSQNTTLYAHFLHNQHRVNWDYSYVVKSGSGTTIATIQENNTKDRIKYGKLVFYFRDGTSDYRILDVTNASSFTVDAASDYPLKGHTIVSGEITFLGSGSDPADKKVAWCAGEGNAATFTVHLTDDQLAQFVGYKFYPMISTENVAGDNWITTTNEDNHVTTFSFAGNDDDNNFPLQWTVTLSGLAIYPQSIFVQPMYWDGGKWEVISQTYSTAGIECQMNKTAQGIIGGETRTYSGHYPVWRFDGNEEAYRNRIGLIGFELNGQRYYLKEDGKGNPVLNNPDAHYISTDEVTCTTYDDSTNPSIEMTMNNTDVPVLRLDANGGTLAATSPYIVVTTYQGTITAPNSTYSATRPGYDFLGWADSKTATAKAVKYDSNLTGYTTSSTIYAVWRENVAPVITTQGVEYLKPGVKLTVSVTDNLPGVKVYCHTEANRQSNNLAGENVNWVKVEPKAQGSNLYDIYITNNRSRAYIWIKAVDAAGNVSYAQSGNLKVDGVAPTVFLYPTGNVCNFDGQFTVTDDMKIAKIELKHDSGDWYEVNEFKTGASITKKEFTLPKPTAAGSANGEGSYSIRVTDEAGNSTVIENIITMFFDHDFANGAYHEAKDPTAEADGALINHRHCKHDCGHIWATDEDKCGPLDNYNRDSETQKYAQGLMRAETEASFLPAASFVIKDESGKTIGATDANATLNDVITLVGTHYENYTIKFTTNKNVDATSGATLANPANAVKLDLNGCGVLVNGAAREITGNSNVTFVLKDESGYKNQSTITVSPITYSRDMTDSKSNWGTLVLPYDIQSTDDFTLYTLSSAEGNQLTFSEADTVKANTPCMYKKKKAAVLNFTGTGLVAAGNDNPATDANDGWKMVGCYEKDTLSNQEYYIKNDAFKYAGSNITVKPFRAWIEDTSAKAGEARNLTFVVSEEETTSLSAISTTQQEVIYDLMGRRLSSPKKGQINIINGQKTLVK